MRHKITIVVVLMGTLVGAMPGQVPGFPTPEPPLAPPIGGKESKPPIGGGGSPKMDLPGGIPGLPGAQPPTGSPPADFPSTTKPLPGTTNPPLSGSSSGGDSRSGAIGNPDPYGGFWPSTMSRVVVDPPHPQVIIKTRVNEVASPNDEVTYRLQVVNPTTATASQVRVRQSIPLQGKFIKATPPPTKEEGGELVWQIGTMEGGVSKDIVVIFQANGNADLESTARVSFEYGQTVRTKLQTALQVRSSGPTSLMVNDTFTLTTLVTHAGNSPLEDVVLTQTVPQGVEFLNSNPAATGDNLLQWRLGKMAPGETKTITIQMVARKPGPIESRATVTSGTQKKEADIKLNVGQVALEVSKGGPDRRVVGRPATYFISVNNTGSSPASNVKITNKVDPNVEFLSADSGGAVVQGEVRWIIPVLGPGEKRTVSMTIRALRSGELKNRAEVVADRIATGFQLEKLTRFENPKGLMVELDKTNEPIGVGEQTTFRVRLLNHATQAYNGAVVTVTLPPEFLVLDARGQTAANRQGQMVIFAPIASLLPNQMPEFSVSGKAIKAGDVRIRAEVKSGDLPGGQLLFEEGYQIIGPGNTASGVPSPPPTGLPGGLPGL